MIVVYEYQVKVSVVFHRILATASRVGSSRLLLSPSNLFSTQQTAWPLNDMSGPITSIFKTRQRFSFALERKSKFLPANLQALQDLPRLLSNLYLLLADHTPATLAFWQFLEQPKPFPLLGLLLLFPEHTGISQSLS